MLIFKFLYITQKSRVYTERQAYVQELMTQASRIGGTKFYVDYTHLDEKNRLFMAWGLAYESLYLSALKSPDSPLSIASMPDTPQLTYLKGMKTQLCTPFNNYPYTLFRPHLFNFRDTTNGYKLLRKADVEGR
ncbi:MAG: hypothetical protein U5L45_21105 [Saprospiraceae bacterium]|nr:hypothetical protein [Saprospiraceae bacterium]